MKNELQAQEKTEVCNNAEEDRPGPVYVPAVDIYESEDSMILEADMPGVDKEGLSVDIQDNTLTIRGRVSPLESPEEKTVHREFEQGDYYRQFTLSELIDQEKITASLQEGVLTLVLPKLEPSLPRKIEVAGE